MEDILKYCTHIKKMKVEALNFNYFYKKKRRETRMNIEKALKEYKRNKGKIITIEERYKYWQKCLNTMTDEEIANEFIYKKPDTYGMPKTKNIESPVESEVIKYEVTREMVKQWIKDEKSRVSHLKYEIKQIEVALKSLTDEENYVIECKCINNWKWYQVEISFNEKFRNKDKITNEQLKKIKLKALRKMEEIVEN